MLAQCIRICDNSKEEIKAEYQLKECQEPGNKKNSYYFWCNAKIIDINKGRKQACRYDACKGCCVQRKFTSGLEISTVSMKKCLKQCSNTYMPNLHDAENEVMDTFVYEIDIHKTKYIGDLKVN